MNDPKFAVSIYFETQEKAQALSGWIMRVNNIIGNIVKMQKYQWLIGSNILIVTYKYVK